MKKIIMLALLFISKLALGQLAVNTSLTTNQMIQNFVGTGVTVSNITYTGGAASRGSFSNGNTTNLGLTSGILLCTGAASTIPNPASFFMSTNLGLPGDANLNSINNGCLTYDASILEFDFIPTADTVEFKYVFGSEEYPNYICSQYNDVFAFFVNGPNPSGGNYTNYNIALIPGTNIPVSVNSVNSGTPGGSYNSSGCLSLAYSNYFVNNAALNGTTIAFGGFTKPLKAKCHVTPCQTYHLKIAVADGYNGLYDSGVFLEANSFSTNSFSVNTSYSNTTLGNNAVEGCSDGIISFVTQTPVSSPLTINYTIGGTATNGTDYPTIPTSVTIPVGQDSAAIIIHPVLDGITEGTETVILSVSNGCNTLLDTIYIIDNISLHVNVGHDTTICQGSSANLTASISGGIAPFTYSWNNAAGNSATVTVSPAATTTYIVSVSDYCASSAKDTVVVNIAPNVIINASASPTSVCTGQTATLTASGANSYVWMPGNITGATINVTPTSTTTYTVVGTSNQGCTANDTVSVNIGNLVLNITSTNENCGHSDGTATVSASGSCGNNFTYLWSSTPAQTTPSIANLATGNYVVTVSCGTCTNTASVSIQNSSTLNASFIADPQVTTIDNNLIHFMDNTLGTITSWVWSLGDGTSQSIPQFTHTYTQVGTYTVTLTVIDNHNCMDSISEVIIIKDNFSFYIPNSFTPNQDNRNDVFTPYGNNIDPDQFEMIIFDRWGAILYETKKWLITSCEGWNGTKNNTGNLDNVVSGVYVYKIHAGNSQSGYKTYTGSITLIP
ncbi:MAG: choice-of-anchor L domain-containing protein [Bacteroidota bacterium]